MLQIILADSNELIRIGLRTLFKSAEIEVISEATNNDELVAQVESFKPDVVLIDYSSDDFTIDVIPRVLEKNQNVKFVAITPFQSAQTVIHAVKSGVTSHVKKDCCLEEIVDSVRETHDGKTFFCGQILDTIRKEQIDVDSLQDVEFNCDPIVLSSREVEVITMIAEGLTNAQISEKLFLSKHTVNTHRKNIMNKLGVKNTAGIVMYAVKEKFTSPNKYLFSAEE